MKRQREWLRLASLLLLCWIIVTWVHRNLIGPNRPAHVKAYIEAYAPAAQKLSELSGVPAAIPLAVAGLESGWGSSELAQKGHNHFGIKAHGRQKRYCLETTEYFKGRRHRVRDCFRAYSYAEESYFDFTQFLLTQPRYDALFQLPPDDYEAWAEGLQEAGYATDPAYARKLVRVIKKYKLYTL